MRPSDRTVEQEIARLAGARRGLVTRVQLLDAGITEGEVKSRLRNGMLLREYPGVYRVGHRAVSLEADYLAAVLACGPGALLRGAAAGHLLGIIKGRPPAPEVVTPTERDIAGVRTVRARHGMPEAATWRGIPITTVARTLVDLAATLSLDDLARACHEAGVLHRTTPREVDVVLAGVPNAPGAGRLRVVLRGEAPVTLSALERRFLAVLRAAGLELPETNRLAGSQRVDCRWPRHRLTVELDSYRFHNSRYAWEQDRRREREARARGDEFRRYTHGDVFDGPAPMLAELDALLGSRRPA
jgi:hypothetical protein